MTKRTLQEWADFLGKYVVRNADGSAYAYEDKPYVKVRFSKQGRTIVTEARWTDDKPYSDAWEIPSWHIEDGDRRMKLGTGEFMTTYYPDWEDSLKCPSAKETKL